MAEYVYRTSAPLMSPEISKAVEDRFWRLVDKSSGQGPDGECWEWTGPYMSKYQPNNPYPHGFSIRQKRYRCAHIALAISGRLRPSGEMESLHSCDNPRCVRPGHLRWGTREENMKEARDRQRYGARYLSPDLVREIRASPERNKDIAERLGVTASCICNIRKRVTHKNVD